MERLTLKKRLLTIFTAFDHIILALITLGGCFRGETLSAVAWSLERQGKFLGFTRPLIDWLLAWLEDNHCQKQWDYESYLRKLP
jgi:hypothetical protein